MTPSIRVDATAQVSAIRGARTRGRAAPVGVNPAAQLRGRLSGDAIRSAGPVRIKPTAEVPARGARGKRGRTGRRRPVRIDQTPELPPLSEKPRPQRVGGHGPRPRRPGRAATVRSRREGSRQQGGGEERGEEAKGAQTSHICSWRGGNPGRPGVTGTPPPRVDRGSGVIKR